MAEPTPVNGQITDAVSEDADAQDHAHTQTEADSNESDVIGSSPAVALSTLYQASAQSLGIAMQNAVSAQQSMNTLAMAVTASSVKLVQSVPGDQTIGLEDLLRVPMLPTMSDEENN